MQGSGGKASKINDSDELWKRFGEIKAGGGGMDENATTDQHMLDLMQSMYATHTPGEAQADLPIGGGFRPRAGGAVPQGIRDKYKNMFGTDEHEAKMKALFEELIPPTKAATGKPKSRAASLKLESYQADVEVDEEDEDATLVPEYSSKTLMSRLDTVDCFNIKFSEKAQKKYPRDTFMQGVPVHQAGHELKVDITLTSRLGKGSFGQVWKGTTSSAEVVAVKQIELLHKRETAEKQYRQIKEEVRILKLLDHPHVVRYYGSFFHDHNMASIVMEFVAGGSVYEKLRTGGAFSEDVIRDVVRQTLLALQYVHGKKVVHRDIKGQNVMLTPDRVVKLVDFGCSKLVEHELLQERLSSQSVCDHSLAGTCHWMAPEVINTEMRFGTKSDIWSLGCTVYEMATLHPPYHALAPDQALQTVLTGRDPPPALPPALSAAARAFTAACLTRDKTQRPAAAQLLQHDFIKQAATAPTLASLRH